MTNIISLLLAALLMITGTGCQRVTTGSLYRLSANEAKTSETDILAAYPNALLVEVDEESIVLSGNGVDEKKDRVFISHDIVYYEDKDSYDSGNPYGEGESLDRHTAEEAQSHSVLNITAPGEYIISGKMSKGQILVDLGDDAKKDSSAVVKLILNGADISCSVAPAVVIKNAYECDSDWSVDTANSEVNTDNAGAIIELADGSVNNITGSHIAKIYKDEAGQKKLNKMDGSIESKVSLNIQGGSAGDGILNLTADREGIECNLHLTILSGNINIFSQDDGINANEDGVSVLRIDGGKIHILGGLGSEGDGVDSNGWLVINGGTVIAMANPASDAGLDSDMGSYVNGGTVVALGSTMDWAESDSNQVTVNLQFADYRSSSDAIVLADTEDNVVFAYDPAMDEIASANLRRYKGAVVSCPNFQVDSTYNLFIGGSVEGTEDMGVYLIDGNTKHSGGEQMGYTGTDVRGFGRPGDMPEPPEGFDSERPERPQGGDFNPGDFGGERPEPPEGFDGERPERPQGGDFNPGDFGGERPEMPQGGHFNPEGRSEGFDPFGGEVDENAEAMSAFYMQDKVNNFSGIKAV